MWWLGGGLCLAAQPCVGCMLTSMVNVNTALATAQSTLTHISPCSNSLCSWGAAWTPADLPPLPPEPESGSSPAEVAAAAAAAQARQREELTRPDPRSTLHAVVQLLARLSKDHALAEKVGGVLPVCEAVYKAACQLRRAPCEHVTHCLLFPPRSIQQALFLPCLACNLHRCWQRAGMQPCWTCPPPSSSRSWSRLWRRCSATFWRTRARCRCVLSLHAKSAA